MENLEIEPFADNDTQTDEIHDIIRRYKTHPSILKIKEHVLSKNLHFLRQHRMI